MADIRDTGHGSKDVAVRRFTHAQFAQEVAREWEVDSGKLRQSRWGDFYNYSLDVDGAMVVVGSYDGRFSVFHRSDRLWEVLGEVA